ncbi:MAG: hypothetical protein OMM_15356, partial [Candidatus Magnetoglobus multicellularis str. Araruama]
MLTNGSENQYHIDLETFIESIQVNYHVNFGETRQFKIKFQQYFDLEYPFGGREWDNIVIDNSKSPTIDLELIELQQQQTTVIPLEQFYSDEHLTDLNISAFSKNSYIIANENIEISGTKLLITPNDNVYGAGMIELIVSCDQFSINKDVEVNLNKDVEINLGSAP